MDAIYYVKYLKDILDNLGIRKKQLAEASEVAESTLGNVIARHAITKVIQTKIRRALEDFSQKLEHQSLEDFIAKAIRDNGRPLTSEDVFQTADRCAPGYVQAVAKASGSTAGLVGPPYGVTDEQLTAINDGAYFTPYLEDALRRYFLDQKIGDPPEGLFRRDPVEKVAAVVSERRRKS